MGSAAAVVVRTTGVRAFAAAAAANSDLLAHKPPVAVYGIIARYANATYSAASKKGLLEKVESELNGLAKAATDSPAFANFLENPLMSRDLKSQQIASILQEKKISQITINLCTTLAGNAKLQELSKVVATYGTYMKAKRGEVDATIISGIQIKIGDQFLDLSIKSRIQELSRMSI